MDISNNIIDTLESIHIDNETNNTKPIKTRLS